MVCEVGVTAAAAGGEIIVVPFKATDGVAATDVWMNKPKPGKQTGATATLPGDATTPTIEGMWNADVL